MPSHALRLRPVIRNQRYVSRFTASRSQPYALAEADAELQRLAILKRNHADEQYVARRNLRELPETIGMQIRPLGYGCVSYLPIASWPSPRLWRRADEIAESGMAEAARP